MNRPPLVYVLLALALSALACGLGDTHAPTPQGPLPTLPAVLPGGRIALSLGSQVVILEDDLSAASAFWNAWTEEPSQVELLTSEGLVRVELDVKPQTAVLLLRHLYDLPDRADGMTLTMSAEGRPFHLVVGVKEEDGSWYHTFLPLDPIEGMRTVEVDFDWLRLDSNGEDENDVLNHDQVVELDIVDISGFIGPMGEGVIEVHHVAFWQGDADPPIAQCVFEGDSTDGFLVGVDANFIPQGERKGTMWYVEETQVDPLALLAAQGVDSLRLRVWVGDRGVSKLDYAVELSQRAHGIGMQVYPVLFLSDDWVDVNKQGIPKDWKNMSLDERAGAIRIYAEETVAALRETGIEVPYYAVGNEIDFGISGVFAEPEQRDLATLQNTIWPQAAQLIRAAVEGIRQADPQARILLHIAQGNRPEFALAFYTAMQELGVDFDVAGLSFYPTAFGLLLVPGLCETIDRLSSELGLQVVIAEYAYPGETPTGGLFKAWYNDLPGYPLTPYGQAAWLSDFLESMRSHPAVIGAYYFSPAYHWSGELWGPFALFDADGRARPAVGAFSLP